MRDLQIRRRTLGIPCVLMAALVFGAMCSDARARQPKSQPTVAAADLAQDIHAQINRERQSRGLTPLVWSKDLSRIAEKHSRDMASRNYLGHDSADGQDFSYRYRQGKYTCEIRVGNLIYTGAENVALSHLYNSLTKEAGVTYYNWNSPHEIAQRTVNGWMNSPGHRKNILAPHWRHEGVGIKIEAMPGNKIYITQNFC